VSDEPHILLGAYILGGLDAHERRIFETHLDVCERCRAEAADFAPLPALLSKADPANLEPAATAAPTSDFTLPEPIVARRAAMRRQRSRRRIGAAAAAVAAVAAAVVIGVVVIPGTHQPPPGTHTFAMRPAAADVTGVVTLTPMPWGTDISLDLQKLPTDGVFTLRTMDENGYMQPAANWAATPNGKGLIKGATSIPMPKLRKLNVVDADNRVLATLQR
jgi:putative zinc finger protein